MANVDSAALWQQLTGRYGLPTSFSPGMWTAGSLGPTGDFRYTGPGSGSDNGWSNFAFAGSPYSQAMQDYYTQHTSGGGDSGSSTDWSQWNPSQYSVAPKQIIVKSGKTEGARFNLVPDANGNLVPQFAGTEYWNTNPDNSMLAKFLGSAALAAGGAYLAQPGGLLSGGAGTAGQAAGGSAALGTPLDTSLGSGLYGMGNSMVPGAIDSGLLNSAGLSTMTPGLVDAGTLGGGLAAGGAGALTGTAAGLFGGAASGVAPAVGAGAAGGAASAGAAAGGLSKWLQDNLGLGSTAADLLARFGPGLLGAGLGLYSANQAAKQTTFDPNSLAVARGALKGLLNNPAGSPIGKY